MCIGQAVDRPVLVAKSHLRNERNMQIYILNMGSQEMLLRTPLGIKALFDRFVFVPRRG